MTNLKVHKAVKRKGVAKKVLSAAVMTGIALGLSAPQAALADGGGGGGGQTGGGSGTAGNVSIHYRMFDQMNPDGSPVQGIGQASIDWFFNNSGAGPVSYTPNARTYMQSACADALTRADARSGQPGSSRVVGMYWAGTRNEVWGRGWDAPYRFQGLYDSWIAEGRKGVLTGLNNQADYYNWIQAGWNDGFSVVQAAGQGAAICIALASNEPGPQNYDLSIETDRTGVFELAGSTSGVRDTIHASNNGSQVVENVTARVILHWDGVEGNAREVAKDVTITNNGDTLSPEFTPADFGWGAWPSGKFWFDVQVSQQGKMSGAVDTPNRDSRETWNAAPLPPSKRLTVGGVALANDDVLASGMSYEARIKASPNGYSSAMTIYDKILTDRVFIGAKDRDVIDAPYILDPEGNRVGGAEIKINRSGGQTIVSGKVTNIPDKFQGREYTLVVPTYVLPTGEDYEIKDGSEVCYADATMSDPSKCLKGNDEQTRKVTPAPDKVWVLNPDGGLEARDPGHTNQEGADEKIFLPGDKVSAVVNGKIHKNLAQNLFNYQIIDDWTKAADYVDFSNASLAKVYAETEPGSGQFRDVTAQFDITVDGTKTIATAKREFLDSTKGLKGDLAMKLIISGQFRDDYDTDGELEILHNDGAEVWNNETVPTNEPPVYTWTPDPNKQVIGSADQAGDKTYEDINGLMVFPGQKLEYSIGVDLRIPQGLAYDVSRLAVQDVYDPQFTPDKSSVEFWDSRDPKNPKPIAKSAYKLKFDEATHSFIAEFTEEWIKKNLTADGDWATKGWLSMRFTGTVKDTAAPGSKVVNQAFQIINDSKTATEIPEVKIPSVEPDKEDLNTDLIDIDGKTALEGDHIIYRLTLDASVSKDDLAYYVHKLGMVDDFDEEYLDLEEAGVKVTNKATGEDVTSKFNIQIKDGVLYVFAKQVDYENAFGELIPGDPQPEDLKAYDEAPIVPHVTPIIDQSLLGNQYWITLDTKVKKTTDGYVIKNQAVQNIENTRMETRIVSNPLKDIDPSKDVVVSELTKDNSINESEVALNSTFNYRLNTSQIPENRAYQAKSWSLTDTFDRVHDYFTGVWAIYADEDLYDGDTLLVKKGALLSDSSGHESEALKGLFDVVWDEESYTIKVTATQKYLDLVNTRGDLPAAFSVYTQMVRIAPGDKIENKTIENYNDVDRESNIVWTSTPENPQIDVEKFTLDEGLKKGDRDDVDDAYLVPLDVVEGMAAADAAESPEAGVRVGFVVTNTGDVPLQNVTLSDMTLDGTKGSVHNIVCEVPLSAEEIAALGDGAPETKTVPAAEVSAYLEVGESFECEGNLLGLAPGELHSDNATATGESVYTGKKVSDEDPWHAVAEKAPEQPEQPEQPDDPKIAVTGGDPVSKGANLGLIGLGGGLLAVAAAFAYRLFRRGRKSDATLVGANGSDLTE